VATIGLLQERAIHHNDQLVAQLEGALASRVVIEQAKGVLAEQGGMDMDAAFQVLRAHARDSNRRLADVAHDVVDRQISIADRLSTDPAGS
jgi:AmiR/NasT family two-component response regulator